MPEIAFVTDSATDSNKLLSLHTPELGGTPVLHSSFTDTISIQSNRVGKDTGGGASVYYYPATPPSSGYLVEADVTDIGNVNRAAGIAGWIDIAADNMIILRRQTATVWQFGKILSGVLTSLATVATSFVLNAVTSIKLVRIGNDFYPYIAGSLMSGSPFTITDSQFQAVGKVGYRSSNNHSGTGYHLDNFRAASVVSPACTMGATRMIGGAF
jgi:hypothetical protein